MTRTYPRSLRRATAERGFVLLSVVLGITLIAVVAFAMSNQSAMQVTVAASELQRDGLRYVAEAGLAHAQWQLAQNTNCTGYANLAATSFGDHAYSASVSPSDGSPVTMTVTATLASGASHSRMATLQAYAAAATLNLQPGTAGIDNYLWAGANEGTNFGATDHISVNNASAERTALIKFDLSSVPANVVIASATMELWLEGGNSVANGVVNAHHVARAWVEGDYDDQAPPAGAGATYQSYDGQTNWSNAGGDYDSTIVASVTVSSLAPAWYSWDVSESVKRWHAGSLANNGLLLRAAGGQTDKILFSSSDSATAVNRPKLVVAYECECGASCATAPDPLAPIAHWMLDDGSGTTAVDSIGSHDGTLVNAPVWTTGKLDGALEFDGINDYVDAGAFDISGSGLTMMGWFNADDLSNEARIVSKATGIQESEAWWQLSFIGGGPSFRVRMRIKAGGVTTTLIDSTVSLQTGQWYFVVASYDNAMGEMKLHLDGVEVASRMHSAGGALDIDPSVPVWIGANGNPARFIDGKLDDVRLYDRAITATEVSDLFASGGGGGSAGYVERYEPWSAADDGKWEMVDLSAFGVPSNAVVEVAVINSKTSAERWGGVRAIGSKLDRQLRLHEAESGGTDVMILHVQADAASRIEHYSEKTLDVTFILLGYWATGEFVETWDLFSAGSDLGWEDHKLVDYGVGPAQVAEILLHNSATGKEYEAGVRTKDSSLERVFDVHESESNGRDAVTAFVVASKDSGAEIQVYAESDKAIEFYLTGFWSTPPGTYTELFVELAGAPSSSGKWSDEDLSSLSVPANAVVQIALANNQGSSEAELGIREKGSAFARLLNLHEAESGGNDFASLHVNTDEGSRIQWYDENTSQDHRFYLLGWWVLSEQE